MVESVRLQPLVSPVWPGGANRLAGALGSCGRVGLGPAAGTAPTAGRSGPAPGPSRTRRPSDRELGEDILWPPWPGRDQPGGRSSKCPLSRRL
jgi:hypothetical protein